MSCWYGHKPGGMNDTQLQQAIAAYYAAAYQAEWERRWQESPFTREMPPDRDEGPSAPRSMRRASLEQARPGDKAGAIDVEFTRMHGR